LTFDSAVWIACRVLHFTSFTFLYQKAKLSETDVGTCLMGRGLLKISSGAWVLVLDFGKFLTCIEIQFLHPKVGMVPSAS